MEEDERAEIRKTEIETPDRTLVSNSNTTFTWNNMSYSVPVKGGNKQLLDKVEGWIKPGQMTALYVPQSVERGEGKRERRGTKRGRGRENKLFKLFNL
jgi:hypothetical protein